MGPPVTVNILFVHEVSYLGKVVFEMHDFPELLAQRGHRVWFIDFPEGQPPASGAGRLLDLRTRVAPGVNRSHQGGTVEVRTPGRVLPPPLDRPAALLTHGREVARTIRDHDIDVVVLYGVPTNGPAALRAAHAAGVPVVFRAIDVSHLLRRTRLAPLILRAERHVYRTADWISTHNAALRDHCVAEGGHPSRISIEYPGVDLARFAPPRDRDAARAELGYAPHHRVAMFMGTLYRFAGLEWFLDGMAPHLRANPDWRILIVGDGEEGQRLRARAGSLGLADVVRFTGAMGYDRLPRVLGAADVAVNPFAESTLTDCALPGKAIQYMATGLPTVTTRLRGLQSVVGEAGGVVFRPGEGFIAEVHRLMADAAESARLGAAARAVMEAHFRWDDCVAAFEARLRAVAAAGVGA
ncbi:MAG: glycosyltransferase family 4 protein [Thermoleophilia bacterium]